MRRQVGVVCVVVAVMLGLLQPLASAQTPAESTESPGTVSGVYSTSQPATPSLKRASRWSKRQTYPLPIWTANTPSSCCPESMSYASSLRFIRVLAAKGNRQIQRDHTADASLAPEGKASVEVVEVVAQANKAPKRLSFWSARRVRW